MSDTSCLQNYLINVAPRFEISELLSLRSGEIFGKFDFTNLLIECEKSLWNDLGGTENSGKSSSQKMSLFATEGRVGINFSIKVTRENMLYLASLLDMNRSAVGQLNPIVEEIVGDPEDILVDALAAWLDLGVSRVLLGLRDLAHGDPVVLLRAEDLAGET